MEPINVEFETSMNRYAEDMAKEFLGYSDDIQELSNLFVRWREGFSVAVWTEILRNYRKKEFEKSLYES